MAGLDNDGKGHHCVEGPYGMRCAAENRVLVSSDCMISSASVATCL